MVSFLIPQMIAVAAFMSALDRINQGFTVFLFIVSTLFHYAVYMVFSSSTLIKDEAEITEQFVIKKESFFRSPIHKLMLVMLLVLFVFDIYLYLGIIRNGSMLQTVQFDQITITSHRGYSYSYPENTLVAIQRAIEVYTDYVEVDVRITQDNEFVLLHDDNLMRTTGLNKSVRSLPLQTIQSLDAGKWLNPKFAGTRIPTLRETLEFTKGKVGVNLDLKLTESQSYVIPDLVAIIDEFEMQYQVLLTSTCLTCLEMVKEINPNIQTGYITYRITPVLLANPSIDVISMKSSFVTQSIVSQVHGANKKILVWTVNSRSEIERMSRLGVNNIITDRPFYAKEVIFKLTADRFIVTLLKVILNS
jgi:glycerophosphoryl diester phosphodiesterase